MLFGLLAFSRRRDTECWNSIESITQMRLRCVKTRVIVYPFNESFRFFPGPFLTCLDRGEVIQGALRNGVVVENQVALQGGFQFGRGGPPISGCRALKLETPNRRRQRSKPEREADGLTHFRVTTMKSSMGTGASFGVLQPQSPEPGSALCAAFLGNGNGLGRLRAVSTFVLSLGRCDTRPRVFGSTRGLRISFRIQGVVRMS